MGRNKRAKDDSSSAGTNFGSIAAGLEPSLYVPPGHDGNSMRVWSVPSAERVLDDIASASYSIERLVESVCKEHNYPDQLGLTGAILERIRNDETSIELFDKYRGIAEEAETLLVEASLKNQAIAGEDIQAVKFYLERRAAGRYGRTTKKAGEGDNTASDIARLVNTLTQKGD